MKALKKPIVILVVYISFRIIQTIYSFAVGENPAYLPYIRLSEAIILAPISYLAVQNKIAALWIMGLILLTQIFAFFWAIVFIPIQQLSFKFFAFLLSMYFVFGGYSLIQLARQKSETKA